MTDGRIQVRPIKVKGMLRKKFRKVVDVPRRVDLLKKVHPLVVLADMRMGSLDSLDLYLTQNEEIQDREVALELRKLIAGSRFRTRFRLLVVEHPDKPKGKGGRPKDAMRIPTKVEWAVARAFQELQGPGLIEAATAEVAAKFKISKSAVRKYVKLVATHEQEMAQVYLERLDQEARAIRALARRERAMNPPE